MSHKKLHDGPEEDSEEDTEKHEEMEIDKPICVAECMAILLGLLGVLLIICGIGFWTVTPPGEDDLCKVETLGLTEKSQEEQDKALKACHLLYEAVFKLLQVISLPFLGCGFLACSSSWTVWSGARAKDEHGTPCCWGCSTVLDAIGVVVVWIPSLVFPGIAAIVSAAMVPIHAYYFTLLATYAGAKVANYSHGGGEDSQKSKEAIDKAAKIFETVYQGYCAASRVEQCLGIGSICLLSLFWVYLFDIGRAIVSICCVQPKYGEISEGIQLCHACEEGKERCCGGHDDGSDDE
eukprot:gnl/MRDRNA2_/MRDRNA2_33692_c0_seq1.p1 gnl/MRDRNA2_/MRDRNA2_33692_c0~~gnl/MRDRNA2_/MRDRNA2_33692_c0_seq1.p1  ORF type:complete len:293 (+),score=53.79 gnl/MRDRNA2_/MRDRNA2_33692_c0_seq1:80-958(+)